MRFSKNMMNRRLQDIYKKNEIKLEQKLKSQGQDPKDPASMAQVDNDLDSPAKSMTKLGSQKIDLGAKG